MDYYRDKRFFRFIIFATLIVLSQCEPANRDIILTPKQSAQVKGKTLYYRPVEDLNNAPGVRVPWERILKHLTYITLFGMPYDQNKISTDNNVDYRQFMNASYIIQTDGIVTNFGDIITLAEGRLEKPATNNKLQFIEGKCSKVDNKCNDKNTVAEWSVQKIRHRDGEKKFRYEIKFSINPYERNNDREEVTEGRELRSGKRVTRSFILRDFDYPNSFLWFDEHVSQRRLEENRRYLERLHRFNEIFMQPIYIDSNFYTSDNPVIPQLNIGEFLINPIQRKSPTYTRFITPTTYRPNYHLKFSKPSLSYEIPTVATQLHHHFYKYEENPKTYGPPSAGNFASGPTIEPAIEYEIPTPPPIKHQIPIPPNYGTNLVYSQYSTPSSLSSSPLDLLRNNAQHFVQQYPKAASPTAGPTNILHQFPTAASPTIASDLVRNLAQNVIQNVAQNLGYQFNQPIVPSIQPYVYNYQVSSTPALQVQDFLQRVTPTPAFVESPRFETTRYSEPDPLYTNTNGVTTPEIPQSSLESNRYYEQQQPTVFSQETSRNQQQQINVSPTVIQTGISPYPNEQLSESPAYTYSSIIDTSPKVEKPLVVDQSTEQNRVVESPNSVETMQTSHTTESLHEAQNTNQQTLNQPVKVPDNLQVPAPSSEISHETTLSYGDSIQSSEYSQSAEILGNNKESTIDSSIDHTKLSSTVDSVEQIHLSQPVEDSAVSKPETSSPTPPTITSDRIRIKSIDVFTATSPANFFDNDQSYQVTKAQAHFKTPGDRPVLKWRPKQPRIKIPAGSDDNDPTIIIAKTRIRRPLLKVSTSNNSSITFERVPDQDTVQKIYKIKGEAEQRNVTTSSSSIPTEQSVSTSISIKVGTSDEQPLLPTISIPNVELYKADLQRLNTDSKSIKFFKASEKGQEPTTTSAEEEITRSIVAHATSLGL